MSKGPTPKCVNLHTRRVCCNIFCFPKELWVNLPFEFAKQVGSVHHALLEGASEKFNHALRSMSQSVCSTFDLYRCKCSSFVAICADAAKTLICSASQTKSFVEDVSNVALLLSGFSSACVFCMLYSCLKLNPLLKTFSHTAELFFVCGNCTSGNFHLNLLCRFL
jgi:hypothetical protein